MAVVCVGARVVVAVAVVVTVVAARGGVCVVGVNDKGGA